LCVSIAVVVVLVVAVVVIVVVVVSCCKAEMRFLLGLPRRNTSTIFPEKKDGIHKKTSKSINFEQKAREYPQTVF